MPAREDGFKTIEHAGFPFAVAAADDGECARPEAAVLRAENITQLDFLNPAH
jgi:hypothetical protein